MSERFVFLCKNDDNNENNNNDYNNHNNDNNNAVSKVCAAPWLPELFSKAVCSLDSINIP